jgi:hypothetical protein
VKEREVRMRQRARRLPGAGLPNGLASGRINHGTTSITGGVLTPRGNDAGCHLMRWSVSGVRKGVKQASMKAAKTQ